MSTSKTSNGDAIARIAHALEANAKQREYLMSLHHMHMLQARGFDPWSGFALEEVSGTRWLGEAGTGPKRESWWLGQGKPKRIAIAVTIEGERHELDPPMVLDDPATLEPVRFTQ
jgi:hypothetical protein